ncbi:MAG: rod shape-determining protein MreD [Treponema sp.]|nr:rod shape-determining protein MreD [Treponema sp.]
MVKSFSVSTVILLCVALVEAAILSNITLLPAVPDIALLCVLFFSLHNGPLLGETTGFMAGLFLDFLSMAPFGLNCLYRTIFGYIGGMFNKRINTEGFFIPALLGFCSTMAKALMLKLISMLYPSSVLSYNPFTWLFVFELVCNTVLAPFVFAFLSLFRNSVILRPEAVA